MTIWAQLKNFVIRCSFVRSLVQMRKYSRIELHKKRIQAHLRTLRRGPAVSIIPITPTPITLEAEMSSPEVNQAPETSTTGASSSSSSQPLEPAARTASLANILDGDVDHAMKANEERWEGQGMDTEEPETVVKEGYCVECEGVYCSLSTPGRLQHRADGYMYRSACRGSL